MPPFVVPASSAAAAAAVACFGGRRAGAAASTRRALATCTRSAFLCLPPPPMSVLARPQGRRAFSSSAATTKADGQTPISPAGTLFFASLCVGTGMLGVWQSSRYFEKVDMTAARERELRADPVAMTRFTARAAAAAASTSKDTAKKGQGNGGADEPSASFRRLTVRGSYDHSREILMGPRGPPPGALASTGPGSGRSSGGMSSSPQGYFVVTPLRVVGVGGGNGNGVIEDRTTILVNRGWVPMAYVKQQQQANNTNIKPSCPWSRPTGTVALVGVETTTEQPKFLSPIHDERNPNQLLWMDRAALEAKTGTVGQNPLLLTETAEVGDIDRAAVASSAAAAPTFPVRPSAVTVGEFKVTPATHAGYAVTWFGLSAAGVVMTRKLITRGR